MSLAACAYRGRRAPCRVRRTVWSMRVRVVGIYASVRPPSVPRLPKQSLASVYRCNLLLRSASPSATRPAPRAPSVARAGAPWEEDPWQSGNLAIWQLKHRRRREVVAMGAAPTQGAGEGCRLRPTAREC